MTQRVTIEWFSNKCMGIIGVRTDPANIFPSLYHVLHAQLNISKKKLTVQLYNMSFHQLLCLIRGEWDRALNLRIYQSLVLAKLSLDKFHGVRWKVFEA